MLLSTGGMVTKAEIQFPLRDPVWVKVCCQGRDVSHVGVVHQGLESDGSSMKEVEDLRPSSRPRYGCGIGKHWNKIATLTTPLILFSYFLFCLVN